VHCLRAKLQAQLQRGCVSNESPALGVCVAELFFASKRLLRRDCAHKKGSLALVLVKYLALRPLFDGSAKAESAFHAGAETKGKLSFSARCYSSLACR
jgi:hypothetical protein